MAGSPAKRPLPTAMVNLSRVLGKHAMEEEDSHADQRRRHGNQDNKSTTSFAKDGSPVGFAGSVLGSRRPRAVLLLTLLALGYAVLVGGGMVVLGVQAASIPAPQLTYYLDYLDAGMSQAQWNKLEPGAQVLDHIPFRAVTLFGRASTAHDSIYVPLPEWEALVANPDPRQAAQAGYSHIYMDGEWWDGLSPVQRQAFEQPCVDIIEEKAGEGAGVRLLIDIRGCKRGN
jgi:hypothetical protein